MYFLLYTEGTTNKKFAEMAIAIIFAYNYIFVLCFLLVIPRSSTATVLSLFRKMPFLRKLNLLIYNGEWLAVNGKWLAVNGFHSPFTIYHSPFFTHHSPLKKKWITSLVK